MYTHENFGATIYKMVTKSYRHFGNDAQTKRLLRILSEPLNYPVNKFSKSLITKKKGECSIKNGSLFTRKFLTYRWKCQSFDVTIYGHICTHLSLERVESMFRVRLYSAYSTLEDIWPALQPCQKNTDTNENNTSWPFHSGPLQCQYCL